MNRRVESVRVLARFRRLSTSTSTKISTLLTSIVDPDVVPSGFSTTVTLGRCLPSDSRPLDAVSGAVAAAPGDPC